MDQHKENFETIKVSCKVRLFTGVSFNRPKAMLDDAVLQAVMKRRGSMSAEHGIGQQKRHLLPEIRSKEEMRVMKMLKSSFDPTNIMNPNKIL